VVLLVSAAGFRIQHSASLPRGLYRDIAGVEPPAGAIAVWCLPAATARWARMRGYIGAGECPGGTEAIGKVVLATAGDTITFSSGGVTLNGRIVPGTRPLAHDARGRSIPHVPFGTYLLRPGEVWLWSPYTPRSFDSRYFGPLSTRALVTLVRPVWTWGPQ
jgi:conjugative transfer signal peptidase TraF